MKTLALILAFAVTGSLADGFGSSHGHRNGRRGGRQQRFRQGRQDAAPAPAGYGAGDAGAQPAYVGGGDALDDALGGAGDDNLAMLEKSVPGVPGEDYPIYAEVPETAFACDGQVDGGYYADPEAECQVFHICTADGQGGLAKYSFLCPNGTVFNQNYFICDWWFNFDCAEAENLYSLNDDIAAEREANSGAADEPQSGYGAASSADYDYQAAADYDYQAATEAPQPAYVAEEVPAEAPPAGGYGAPSGEAPQPAYEAEREARNFRGNSQRQGRNFRGNSGRNGRRQNNRNNGRRGGQRRGRQGRRFRG